LIVLPSVHDSSMLTRQLNGMLLLDNKSVSPIYYTKNIKICRTWEIQIWLDLEQFPRVFFYLFIYFLFCCPLPSLQIDTYQCVYLCEFHITSIWTTTSAHFSILDL